MSATVSSHADINVLVVDDDPDIVDLLTVWLEDAGYRVSVARSGREAIKLLDQASPDLLLTDLAMPQVGGLELIDHVQKTDPLLPVIMVSGEADIPDAVEAAQKGVVHFLTKPLDHDAVLHAVNDATEVLSHESGARFDYAEDILYQGPQMEKLLAQLPRVARGTSSVMIEGESGTGKELLARAIHRAGPRAVSPFVALNCGAMPEQLLESELFGHVKGAFTGAVRGNPGLFRAADGGTLFLDEVGDMPSSLQIRLLRVLQEGLIRPVGAIEDVSVDVRVITATHKDLEKLIEDGEFREDLYYRLNVVPLTLPPLRERREDIPALVAHFLSESAAKQDEPIRRFSPDAMRMLKAADWPGNVRQLSNVVEQCVVLSSAKVIAKPLVSKALKGRTPTMPTLAEAVADFERAYLVRVLRMTEGNVTKAADIAGRNRTDFYNLLNRHQLDSAAFRSSE